MTGKELDEYIKECKVHRDGTIRDVSGKVVDRIDVDSEIYKDIFERNDIVGFSIRRQHE